MCEEPGTAAYLATPPFLYQYPSFFNWFRKNRRKELIFELNVTAENVIFDSLSAEGNSHCFDASFFVSKKTLRTSWRRKWEKFLEGLKRKRETEKGRHIERFPDLVRTWLDFSTPNSCCSGKENWSGKKYGKLDFLSFNIRVAVSIFLYLAFWKYLILGCTLFHFSLMHKHHLTNITHKFVNYYQSLKVSQKQKKNDEEDEQKKLQKEH